MTKRRGKEQKVPEEPEERYFLNPESVSSHLFCSICQDVFNQPYRAPCGHSFCKACITSWLRNSKTCPEDRKSLQFNQMHHDFIVENIIGDQMVACPFRKSGCDFIGQLQMLKSHKKSCDFNPNNLPDFLKNKEKDNTPDLNMTDDEVMPSPAKPSLMMRLFRSGDSQKNLLKTMFEDKENTPST
ncbi:RING finger protein 151-like [Mytilus californianus]|uniref:RING finger protein 151-like n=1 Tax=Mytilus californianus TaxID=6549 RepID=UPI0022451FB0|nr:RING finger protein 151-like [Mytilus californianus]